MAYWVHWEKIGLLHPYDSTLASTICCHIYLIVINVINFEKCYVDPSIFDL